MSRQIMSGRLAIAAIINVSMLLLLSPASAVLVQGQQAQASEVQALAPNHPLERTLTGGGTHSYRVTLKAGEYFHVDVEQRGIDVVILLAGADGERLVERGRPNGMSGQESLSFITITDGEYRLDVKSPDEKAASGKYVIRSERTRTPTARNKKRIEAEKLFQEGLELAREKPIESLTHARTKAEASAALWRDVGDKYAEALTYTVLGYVGESLEQRGEALAAYEKALPLYREVGDRPNEASSLSRLCILNALSLKPDNALVQYREAKTIYRDLKDADGEKYLRTELSTVAEAYLNIGMELFHQGDAEAYRKGLEVLGIARELHRELEDKGNEAFALVVLGRINDDLREKQKALDCYNQALPLYLESGDRPGVATVLNNIGSVYSDLGKKRKALDYYERQALPIWKEVGSKAVIATTLNNIGGAYSALGERQTALAHYNQALQLYKEIKEKSGVATTLNNIGKVYADIGEKQTALDHYSQALQLYRDVGGKSNIALTLNNIGRVYADMGEKQTALAHYNQALQLYKDVGSKAGIATTLNSIGRAYSDFGEKQTALDYFKNQALPLWKEVGDKSGIATVLNNIGTVYAALGEKQKALDYFDKQALPLWKETENDYGIAATFNNIGQVYDDLGERRKALNYYEKQALPLWKEGEDKSSIAATINNIGGVYYDLGEWQTALGHYNQALQLYRDVGEKSGIALTLNNNGRVYSALGEKQKALDHYKEALQLYRDVGEKSGIAGTLNNVGRVYSDLGQKQTALDYYNQALPLYRAVGSGAGEAVILNNMMVVWDDLKVPRLATFYGKLAVNVIQQLRGKNQDLDKEFQKTFLKSVEGSYRYLVKILLDQGRLVEAHQALNAFKDQQQFDFNSHTLKAPSPLAPTQREADFGSRYAVASDKIGSAGRQVEEVRLKLGTRKPSPEESTKLQQLESNLKTATDEYLIILKQAEAEFSQPPDAVKDKERDVKDTVKMQEALRALGNKAIAVYTLVGKDKFYALIVTSGDLMTVSSPIKGDRLSNKAKQLWALLQSDEYEPKALSKEIYDLVFKPIKDRLITENRLEKVLPEGATIMWSLDGNLRYLPMAALYDGEKYLVEHYNNVVFTRADSERWTRPVSPTWTGVGFGSSRGGTIEHLGFPYLFDDLPNVTEELNAIFKTSYSRGGIFIGDIIPDLKFKRAAMLTALKKQRPLVHISSHFKFSPGDEESSFLLLGDGTVFPLNEMRQRTDLFRGVELLTLSACETAAQWANSDGREVDGFAELAQRQGASAVMATLWMVRDDSSYWLMRDFYQKKQKVSKQTKIESLRQGQIALLRGTAEVTHLTRTKANTARKGGRNSATVKILPEGAEFPSSNEDGVVYVEAKYATPYSTSAARRYEHPFYWSPFILFGNWR